VKVALSPTPLLPMTLRILRIALVCAVVSAVAAVGAAAALAAPVPRPLLLGFQDEQSFLWSADRLENLDRAASAHASVVRVTANWREIAKKKPAAPASPADPAYHFEGLDDLVWQSQLRGMRVLLTISGTPKWGSTSGKANAAPRAADLGAFCSAIGSRYNGRGTQPAVTLYSVWNEPNLDQFLHPQFSASGKDVGPQLYAGMARACYSAIKRTNPRAKVAIGDTSPRGHDRPTTGVQASHSPGRFAELVGKARPRVRFDAWAHHPYADGFRGGPTSSFRWPNVGIGDLGRFELRLRKDFARPSVPLWVTEFAYQTRPEHAGALSYGQQASFLGKALQAAAAVKDVQMFVWYVFRDTPGERWQSGVISKSGSPKPGYAAFRRAAALYDVSNPTLSIPAKPNPSVTLSVVDLKAHTLPGDPPLGMTYRVYAAGKLVTVDQAQATIDGFGQIKVKLELVPKPRTTYTVAFDLNDIHGDTAKRTARLVVAGKAVVRR
jgi:Glycosyl hydrolase catalytic core